MLSWAEQKPGIHATAQLYNPTNIRQAKIGFVPDASDRRTMFEHFASQLDFSFLRRTPGGEYDHRPSQPRPLSAASMFAAGTERQRVTGAPRSGHAHLSAFAFAITSA